MYVDIIVLYLVNQLFHIFKNYHIKMLSVL